MSIVLVLCLRSCSTAIATEIPANVTTKFELDQRKTGISLVPKSDIGVNLAGLV